MLPQDSLLRPPLFDIFINDFFVFIKKIQICSFTDSNRTHSCDGDFNSLIESFKYGFNILRKWFNVDSIKTNQTNFQFVVLGPRSRQNIGK